MIEEDITKKYLFDQFVEKTDQYIKQNKLLIEDVKSSLSKLEKAVEETQKAREYYEGSVSLWKEFKMSVQKHPIISLFLGGIIIIVFLYGIYNLTQDTIRNVDISSKINSQNELRIKSKNTKND